MKILVTLPQYDSETSYLSAYAQKAIKVAEEQNHKTKLFKRPELKRTLVEKHINKQNPDFLFLNGHGNETTIFGDKIQNEEEYIFREGTNESLLNGKITFALSCCAGASLGKMAVEGAGCFIGFTNLLRFWAQSSKSTIPLRDKIAAKFLHPSTELAICILKGKTADEAVKKYKSQCRKNLNEVLSKKDMGAIQWGAAMWINIKGVVIHGNREAKLET